MISIAELIFPIFEHALNAQVIVSLVMIYPFSNILKKLSSTVPAYSLLLDKDLKYAFVVSIIGFIPLFVIFSRYNFIDFSAS